ncbi:hypothetical protein JRI60_44040 [Archangium violaceum]|uniref:hypothetical protein n=1 Tax=Archangium violaceum TaxID=83451 RepID=UPI00194E4C2B|nr:hypothetical protein [Archangium violaceum]QRN95940.1 hypothetical protein JRI60_44040 [Archangium violaceum]
MTSLLLVLLAASPVPGQASLLAPAEPRPSARLLVAGDSLEEAVQPSRFEAPAAEGREERIRELSREIEDINARLRRTDTNWPIGSLVMAYAGYVLGPMLLIGLPLIIYGLAVSTQYAATLVGIGAALTVLGGGGVALLIIGIVSGINASEAARVERDDLVRRRGQLEDELRELKQARPWSSMQSWRDEGVQSFLPVASLSF